MVPVPLVGGAYSLRRVTVPTCWRGPCSWRGPGRRSRTETPAFAPREFANEVNLGSVQALEWLVALAKQKEMQKLQLPDAKAKVTLGTIAVGKASCCLHRWPSRRNAGIRPVIPHAEVALDAADLTVDDGWLDPLVPDAQCLSASPGQSSISPAEGVCSALGSTLRLAGRPIVEEYVARPSRDLDRGMPCFGTFWAVRAAIRLISLSGRFTLDGATLTLPRRSLPVSYRGSLHDLTRSLAAEYTVNLLRNVGTVLGKSSVLKLPRAPLKLAGTAMSLVRRPGLAAGEAAALLNELTFDEEFVARQRQQQGVKQIRGIGDGVVEAGKSIAQGVEGLLDVVKKPVQGARSSGIGGFFAGVGLGVAGSLVKPVSRLGQATLNCLVLVSYDGSFSKGSCYNRNDPVQAGQPNATVEGLLEERKRYKYFITHGGRAPNCSHDSSEDCQPWHLKEVLNVSAMQESAEAFVGEHDFHTFTSQHGLQRNATRRILHVGVERVAAATSTLPELLCVSILGESFLYRMVRYIVFALVLAGRHHPGASVATYRQLLAPSAASRRSAKRQQKRQLGLGPAPARGLQLAEAISDVGVGLAAEVSPDSTQRRRSRARRRHPRLICSTVVGAAGLGGKPPPQIRVWSNVEAEVLHQLGVERLRGLQELHANHSVKSQQIPLRHGMQPLGANPSFSKSLSTWKDAARPCSTSELHRLLADARQLRSELLAAKGTVELAKQRLEEQGPRLVHAAEDFKRAAIEEKEAQELAEKSRRQDPAAEASAAIDAAAGAQPLQEEKCYEWLRMLREDKAVHAGIIAVEAECDYWEAQLQDHLVAALPRWKSSREGVQRLDAELQDLALDDRGTSGCDRCLEVLDRDHPRQPFCHLRGIYALLDDLRQRNDNLAAAQSGLRWQRLAEEGQCRSASPEKSPDRKADERYLPPGPKFFSVVQLLQPEDPPPPPEVPRMPKAVVSRSEWFSPWNPQAENGNSFLPSLISSRRLQPSETGSLSWGRPGSYCFEPSIFSSGDYWDPFGGPLPSKTPTSAEVLRRAFEEPLSEVLAGHSGRTGQRPSSAPRAPRKVPSSLEKRQRSGWVTFEATVQTPTSPSPSPNYAVTAPIQRPPPEWEALDSRSSGPARWEVAWPDSAAAFPAPAAALPELPPVPAAFPAPKVSELGFGWDAWEAQESVQLSD
eukprot:s1500_g6.t3